MIVRLALTGFLLAHALIHASFLAPRPAPTPGGPEWPFVLERSWALSPLGVEAGMSRFVGLALVAATIAAYGLAAVALLGGLPVPIWAAGTIGGSIASIALLVLFFHPWLVLGLAIDAGLLVAVLLLDWRPEGLTG